MTLEPVVDFSLRDSVGRTLGLRDYASVKKYQHQIERVIQWARAKGAKDDLDVINSIQKLSSRVGSPPLGTNWAQHLSQFAYLEMERQKLDSEIESFIPKEEPNAGQHKTGTVGEGEV